MQQHIEEALRKHPHNEVKCRVNDTNSVPPSDEERRSARGVRMVKKDGKYTVVTHPQASKEQEQQETAPAALPFPYACVGVVFFKNPKLDNGDWVFATGYLIGPHTIMMAAHSNYVEGSYSFGHIFYLRNVANQLFHGDRIIVSALFEQKADPAVDWSMLFVVNNPDYQGTPLQIAGGQPLKLTYDPDSSPCACSGFPGSLAFKTTQMIFQQGVNGWPYTQWLPVLEFGMSGGPFITNRNLAAVIGQDSAGDDDLHVEESPIFFETVIAYIVARIE